MSGRIRADVSKAATLLQEHNDDALGRLAVLIRLAEYGAQYEAGGVNVRLDQDFWRGVEDLVRKTHADVEAMYQESTWLLQQLD